MKNPTISDRQLYCLTLRGRIDEEFVMTCCPPGTLLSYTNDTSRLAPIRTDQAGLLGLLRHLHNLGYVILALTHEAPTGPHQEGA
ncbi:hypothetical protein [Chloroflexus sp.]|uniref:hypothetical protein n=1 Tax=Chloroflexus sp. TaxID=1904827 RepID=UPI00298EE7B8|nr:hypothetical protein [Chloroflexus sp.]MCS6887932.1 hypothetical protein [Chloroflexus sp.]MDW8404213.1 hypothetical protein [Chloroflexus sp.]